MLIFSSAGQLDCWQKENVLHLCSYAYPVLILHQEWQERTHNYQVASISFEPASYMAYNWKTAESL